MRRSESIVTHELSLSSDSVTESEKDEVANNALEDRSLSLSPTQPANNSEGDMESSAE